MKTLVREDKIFISDRKLVKLYKLFRVRAWLFSGGVVSKDDLRLLAYLGESAPGNRAFADESPRISRRCVICIVQGEHARSPSLAP